MSQLDLGSSITEVKGVGDKVAKLYRRLNVESVEDLIYHFPRRYEDYSKVLSIKDIQPGPVTLKVKVESVNTRYVRRGLHITEAVVSDASGQQKLSGSTSRTAKLP